jgi:hypothetical protein
MTRLFVCRVCFVALALTLASAPAVGQAQGQPTRRLGREAPYWVIRSRLNADFHTPSEFAAGFATREEANQYMSAQNQMEPGGLSAWTYMVIDRPGSDGERGTDPNELPPFNISKPKIPLVPNYPRRPGGEQEVARLQTEGRAIVEYGRRLTEIRKQLAQRERTLDDALRRAEADTRSAIRRRHTFRCPVGLTVEQCLSRPPVCTETRAFMRWFNSEISRLQRRTRDVSDARNRFKASVREYESQVRAFNQRTERWESEVRSL